MKPSFYCADKILFVQDSILTKNILYRYNIYASYKAKLNDTSTLTFVNYLQPSVDDIQNIRVKSHFNLKLKIYKNLSLSNDIKSQIIWGNFVISEDMEHVVFSGRNSEGAHRVRVFRIVL